MYIGCVEGDFVMSQAQTTEAVSINIRAKTKQRDLIDQAAERLGRSRSDFMLEAACSKAENVLLDQTFFCARSRCFCQISSYAGCTIRIE